VTGKEDVKGGFAGLADLVPSLKLAASPQTPSEQAPHRPEAASPIGPVSGVRWRRVALVAGAVGMIVILNITSNTDPPNTSVRTTASVPPVAVSPAVATGASESFSPISAPDLALPAPTDDLREEIPPVGPNRVLTGAQLTYCVAQDARLEVLQPAINNSIKAEVSGYNRLVDDFNKRCTTYQYYKDEMANTRAQVAAHHDQLAKQAMTQLRHWHTSGGPSNP
jgi:hypothetical protein